MKKIFWLLLILFISVNAAGQSESEPNNTFATADLINPSNVYTASVGNGDAIDYFRLNYTLNKNFYLLVEATNISGNSAFLKLDMYDGREGAGLIYTKNISNNLNIPAGETVYDTIYLCAQSMDNYFIAFTTNEEFDYQIQWFPVDPYPNDEPNNTSGQAIPFAFNSIREGSVRYIFRGNATFDQQDWFQSGTLPAGDYNTIKLYLTGVNNSCAGGTKMIFYDVYKSPNLATPFASGTIGNTSSAPEGIPVKSTISLSNMVAGDIFYVRLTSNAPFGYTLRYTDLVPFTDPEDNCCYYNARPLTADSVVGGNVGEYDIINDVFIDEFDTYRIIVPHDGAIKIFAAGELAGCGPPEIFLQYDLLDKYGNEIIQQNELVTWTGTPACGNLKYDTVKIRALGADTFYLRLRTYDSWSSYPIINYNIKYQFVDSTGSDLEPNNDTATAIAVTPGQIKKGHINFRSSYANDVADYYKTALPADGKVTVYLKATFRDTTRTNNSTSYRLGINYITNNITYYSPSQTYSPILYADSVIFDTIQICPALAGNFYFRFISGFPYEYEFSFVITDTSSWVNDIEPNNNIAQAIPIAINTEKTGRLRHYPDRVGAVEDQNDYYRADMPSDGTIKVYVEAKNMTCANANALVFYLNDPGQHNLITRNIGNLASVPPGVTIYDTITVCGRGDTTMYFSLQSTQAFRYKLRYEITDTSENDIEPNGIATLATLIGGSQTKKGHIRYIYDYNSNTFDGFDYYKIAVGDNDSLKLIVQGTNTSCTNSDELQFRLLNANLSTILTRNIGNNAAVPPGVTVYDTIKIAVVNGETKYVRVSGSNAQFKYQFTTNALKPVSNFSITGDTTACLGTYTYNAVNIIDTGIAYNWSLPLGGGTISHVDSVATVNWTSTGNRRVQLILSNGAGSSLPKILNVIVNGAAPTQVPVAFNFARTLSTNSLPAGATCQWYRNDTLIAGATDSSYYAAAAGSFTVKFINDCGPGLASNAIIFPAAAQSQTITFPHVPTVTMSPTAKAALQATASSSLPVFYQKISGPGNIINDTLFITGTGTIIVKALQPGDDIYSAATSVNDTITVIKGNQVITFDSIPGQIIDANKITLTATSSMGQTISYSIIAGSTYASVSSNKITKKGAGIVTVRASQTGNSNYNPATPVDRTFCIGVRTLTPITGDANPCIATYRYNTQKIPGAIFVWTLSGGGILTTNNDTAWVQWQTPGSYTLTVKANSTCDPVYTNTQSLTIATSNNVPGAVSGMLPLNNAIDQHLPLTLSWIPGNNTVNYDLFLWDSTLVEPATPYASNIAGVSYVIPLNALIQNKTYKWKIVSKNPCSQTAGPIQKFKVLPLPDLVVSDVQAPATANSGQTITISWKVTNIGPGRTLSSSTWEDGVYFALDTLPNVNFNTSPNWNAYSWNSLTANGRPLLLGKRVRPTSLDSGQFYTNSLNFTLPINYSFPVYVYVITNNQNANYPILQVSVANDTARKQDPIIISLSPTPDFRVDSVFAPTSTFSGSTVNLTYKVKNYGVVTPAGSNWTDSVFMSQSPLFDRNNAILINTPKPNASYYPNAVNATAYNNTQLLPDSFYTKNLQVVIPNYIFGTWFIYVKANANTNNNAFVYEGALNNNNINRAQVQVYLTPTPKLTVSTVTLPVTTASTTQPVGANWNIKNEGFRDNIEKNRGHYITMSSCTIPCGPGSPPNSACTAAAVASDSIAFGSSYWLDRIYLSTDSSGFNLANATLVKETTHGVLNSGSYPDPNPSYVSCPALVTANVNINTVIHPGADFTKAENFTIPSNLQPGNYYVYVYTNPTKVVFEYPGTPQIKRSTLPIAVSRPDATVSAISVPANTIGGTTIGINYSITNIGPGAVFNHIRRDRLYISNFPNFDGSAQLIGTQTFTEDLPVATGVPHTFTYTISPATTGAKYFYVHTNYDSSFRETNATNNISIAAGTTVSAAIASDLVVSSVLPADSVFTVFTTKIKYTVTNNGSGTTAGTWRDSLFISCSPTYNPATSYYIGKLDQARAITTGGNYTDSINLNLLMAYNINNCFPQQMYSSAYFYVKTNANNGTYEGSNTNNNVGSSGNKVIVNPLVDQIVTTVLAPDTTTVGFAYPVNWRVKNIGYNPNQTQYYYYWYDAIYFSTDSIASANDVKAGEYLKYLRLNRNQDSADSKSPYTPVLLTGDYYVYVKTNSTDKIPAEKILSNNTNFIRNASGFAKKIHVIRPALADLTDSILSAPVSVAAGQPITVIYKITNNGTGLTYPGSTWQNQLWLSEDFAALPNTGDRLLATRTRTSALPAGQFYYDTVTATIPTSTIPGNYVLIGEANSNNVVAESNTNNNLGFSLITVFTPPQADLTVTNVLKPDTAYLGYTMDTAKWVITNASGEEARGYTSDGIYLSAGNLFDATAVLIGIKNKNIIMAPLQSDTVRMAPLVTGVVEGNYNVFVKTDLLNNIIESDKDNNTGMSATPVYVKVKELLLNVPEAATLQTVSRYYKLRIPDSLRGSTILVTLKTNDSLTMRNEMFIGGGYVPTPAHYNYRFEIPNYGNQQIVMASVTDSVYYIMARCVSPNPVLQNITLKAVKLPFAILNVHTNSGGNIGNVTIRIRGSLYRDSMIAILSKPGTTIYASAVYFTNSTQVFATFNLQGKPLGIYDVTLMKPDSSTAILPNGFSVVVANNGGIISGGGPNTGSGNGNAPGCDPGAASGLNSQLVVELVVPARVLKNRPVVIQIHYNNPTNFDIPAQSRILYSEAGMKMAFTKEGVPTGTTSLYLELTEPGGPPGIIRAGGSGTITVHTKAPNYIPPSNPVLFKLK